MALQGDPNPYQLDGDLRRGFKTAVRNNQLNLALHYMVEILDEMDKTDDVELAAEAEPPSEAAEEAPAQPKAEKKRSKKDD